MTQPLVSVVTPFLNGERFLEEAIQSVLAQTYARWELLLADDGSRDGSSDIARKYAAQYPGKIRYLQHSGHSHRGESASRNLALQNAAGEVVAFVDADDVLLPDKLERQVLLLKAHPEAGTLYDRALVWYSWTGRPEDAATDRLRDLGVRTEALYQPPTLLTVFLRDEDTIVSNCSMLVRRSLVEQVGAFEEDFPNLYDDLVFYAKIILAAPVFVADGCSAKYRHHARMSTSVAFEAGEWHPSRLNPARLKFLEWLEWYLEERGLAAGELWAELQRQLWPYRHPVLHRLRREVEAYAPGRLGLARSAATAARWAAGKSFGYIKASPNPIRIYDGAKPAVTTLRWKAHRTTEVEVRVGAPDGDLFSRSGPVGSETTGNWVRDGQVFYLQDVSNAHPLTADHTLATTKVRIVDAGARSILPRRHDDPAVGNVRFGDFRRLHPIGPAPDATHQGWGLDRGTPIDRYYIDAFLKDHATDIRGRVLEIGDNRYTRAFGGSRVTRSDVLAANEDVRRNATIVADLVDAPHIPSSSFDCIIITQTLQFIYDVRAAVRTLQRILSAGGVILATFPGVSQTYDAEWAHSWYWNFTTRSARRMFEEAFLHSDVQVESVGNVLAAVSFLEGLAAEDLRRDELDYRDPAYEFLVTVRAVNTGGVR